MWIEGWSVPPTRIMKRTRRRWIGGLAAGLFAGAIAAGAASAYEPVGTDLRLSTVGTDTDTARYAFQPAVAYNTTANEYLVVWEADGLPGMAGVDQDEIFGQRVSAAGAELGGDFRISNVGLDTDPGRDGSNASVAYNPTADEYLVAWQGDGLAANDELEIFGQRLRGSDGAELGTDFRISNVDVDAARDARTPSVAYNTIANEYLVAWQGDGLATAAEFEIFGQRVSAAGAELGMDFRISNADTDTNRDANAPSVAYNPTANEYLVAWEADNLATDEEFEIFGQRVSAAGAELLTDFRISTTGTDADATRDARHPSVGYGSASNQYLVAWQGDGLSTDEETEIFGQRLRGSDGVELGIDFVISNAGTETDASRDALDPSVGYSSAANEFLVAWWGDGLATANENEVFGQRLSVAGAELGADFRISTIGPETDPDHEAADPVVAYNPTANQYLVAFTGEGLDTEDEFEIFGHRLAVLPPPAALPITPAPTTPAAPAPIAKKCKKGQKLKKGKCVKKKKRK